MVSRPTRFLSSSCWLPLSKLLDQTYYVLVTLIRNSNASAQSLVQITFVFSIKLQKCLSSFLIHSWHSSMRCSVRHLHFNNRFLHRGNKPPSFAPVIDTFLNCLPATRQLCRYIFDAPTQVSIRWTFRSRIYLHWQAFFAVSFLDPL